MPRGYDIDLWRTRRSTKELDGVHHRVQRQVRLGHRFDKHIDQVQYVRRWSMSKPPLLSE